jgi:hypothetical protein
LCSSFSHSNGGILPQRSLVLKDCRKMLWGGLWDGGKGGCERLESRRALPEGMKPAIILGFPECVQGDLTRRAVISAFVVCCKALFLQGGAGRLQGVSRAAVRN